MTFVHLPFSVRSFDLFRRFTCVHEGHFILCNKEEFQIELSRKIVLWQIFIGHRSASFPLLSACRLVEFDTSVICHVSVYCKGSFLLQDMLLRSFKSPRICFRGTKHEIYREHVAYLHSILCVGPGFDLNCLQYSRFLSRMSYFVLVRFSSGDAVALLRESYILLSREILMFLAVI